VHGADCFLAIVDRYSGNFARSFPLNVRTCHRTVSAHTARTSSHSLILRVPARYTPADYYGLRPRIYYITRTLFADLHIGKNGRPPTLVDSDVYTDRIV